MSVPYSRPCSIRCAGHYYPYKKTYDQTFRKFYFATRIENIVGAARWYVIRLKMKEFHWNLR